MKRKAKVLMTFLKESIPNKIPLGRHVYDSMQSSGLYPSPPVSYADMLLIQNELSAKIVGDQGGSTVQYLLQNAAEKAWNEMMRKQAGYVNFIADGDKEKIIASGFPVSATELQRWHLPNSGGMSARVTFNNRIGGIDIKAPDIPKVTAYNYLLVTDPHTVSYANGKVRIAPGNAEIVHICAKQKKITVRDLTKGCHYYIFVYATNTAGTGSPTQPVSVIFPGR